MLEGRRIYVIRVYKPEQEPHVEGKRTRGGIMLEEEHRVDRVVAFRRAGEPGGNRKLDLINFIARAGGSRWIAVEDIVEVRRLP